MKTNTVFAVFGRFDLLTEQPIFFGVFCTRKGAEDAILAGQMPCGEKISALVGEPTVQEITVWGSEENPQT